MTSFCRRSSLFLLATSLVPLVWSAIPITGHIPTDPFQDPKHDPLNPLKYIASNALTGIAVSLVLVVALTQSYFVKRWGAKWMLSMVIGAYTFALGLSMRFALHELPRNKGIYIVEYLFVVLSPCAFIAADYILLGRLSAYLRVDHHLLVPSRKITMVFISSDISTFLIQAVGGALSVSADEHERALVGSRIFLGGLVLQLLSFLIFSSIYLTFIWRVYKHEQATWLMQKDLGWFKDWRTLALMLGISCVGILIRSAFRVAELSQGFLGPLASSEAFFYGLDTLPLFIAISVYVPFWPGRFINSHPQPLRASDDSVSSQDAKGKESPS